MNTKNKKAVIFFENYESSWSRYPKSISDNFVDIDCFFAYNIKSNGSSKLYFKDTFHYYGNIKKIYKVLDKYRHLIIVIMSYRPIDLIFTTHLKLHFKNLISVSVQHGIYSKKLRKTSLTSFLFQTKNRIYSYVYTLFKSKIFSLKYCLIILKEILLVNVFYTKSLRNSILSEVFHLPQNVLILNKSWTKYYNENFYKFIPNFFVVPHMDLSLLKNLKFNKNKNVVFVAQSLVEDGRYPKHLYIQELEMIFKCIPKDFTITIKRHPRGINSIYENLSRNVIFSDKLVVSDYIISGYSSLMFLYKKLNCRVFSWKFNKHENDSYFNNFADKNGRSKELINFFNLTPLKIKVPNLTNPSKIYADTIIKLYEK